MAGKLVLSTLNDDTGVLATQNGMTGICKAWVRFTGSTGAIIGSFNVSSVTRSGTGTYVVNFTTAMPNANYSASGLASSPGVAAGYFIPSAFSTTTFSCNAVNSAGSLFDGALTTVMIVGD
jgi:hypothetical protein